MAVELERLVGGIGVVALVRRESGGACRLYYGVVKGLAHLVQSVLGIQGGETAVVGGPLLLRERFLRGTDLVSWGL